MEENISVHPFCDVCGKELSEIEIEKNQEHGNCEFPFCDDCFKDAMNKIRYIVEN